MVIVYSDCLTSDVNSTVMNDWIWQLMSNVNDFIKKNFISPWVMAHNVMMKTNKTGNKNKISNVNEKLWQLMAILIFQLCLKAWSQLFTHINVNDGRLKNKELCGHCLLNATVVFNVTTDLRLYWHMDFSGYSQPVSIPSGNLNNAQLISRQNRSWSRTAHE